MSVRKYFTPESYADFKLVSAQLTTQKYVFYAVSVGVAHFIFSIEPTSEITIWTNDGSLNATTIASDYPNAVDLSATTNGSALNIDNNFASASYDEWKLVVNKLNLGGPIFYHGSNYAVAVGSDGSWWITCNATLGGSFATDFPNAIAAYVL